MIVEIDDKSGFCHGVIHAIKEAEKELGQGRNLFSLGDLMHNKVEMNRLEQLGLKSISMKEFDEMEGGVVLIRAHGEPIKTYQKALKQGISLIDATCKVVSLIQKFVQDGYDLMDPVNGQIVILGKKGHPEVVGLSGQVERGVTVIETEEDLINNVDFSRPIFFLSQTTQSLKVFCSVRDLIIKETLKVGNTNVIIKDTICRQVSNRYKHLQLFSETHDVILFVSGKESSNGSVLFKNCLETNSRCYKIETIDEIDWSLLDGAESIGICGATSTPRWIMEQVRSTVLNHYKIEAPLR